MYIGYLINGLGIGGGERLLEDVATALAERHRVVIFTLKRIGSIGRRLRERGIAVRSLTVFGIPLLWRWLQLGLVLRRADIAHAHFFYSDVVLAVAKRIGIIRGRALSTRHETGYWMRPWHRRLESWVYGAFDRVLCVSEAVRAAMHARGVVARLEVLRPRPSLPITPTSGDRHGIVCVARLERVKGVDVLLRASAALRAEGIALPNVTIAGAGPMALDLAALVDRLGLGDVVQLAGALDPAALHALLARSELFCLPSRSEAYPLSLVEAMAHGLAPIVSATAGALEVLGDSAAAVVVPVDDEAALARAIVALLRNDERRLDLQHRARIWAAGVYRGPSYSEQLEQVYEGIVESTVSPRCIDVCMLVRNPFVLDGRVERQVGALTRRGLSVLVLAEGGPNLSQHERRDGYDVARLTTARHRGRIARWQRTLEFYARAVLETLRAHPRVVHCHDLDTLVPGSIAATLVGARLVYDSHELWTERNHGLVGWRARLDKARYAMMERLFIRRAAAVSTVSEGIADELARRYRIARPTVLRNVPEAPPALPRSLRARLRHDGPILLFLGQAQQRRGIEASIEALGSLPAARLVLVGEAPKAYRATLEALAMRLDVTDRLEFFSPVPRQEIVAWARDADVGLCLFEPTCLSHRLALPNKFFEYLLAGLPIVASDMPEVRAWMDRYRLGAVCETVAAPHVVRAVQNILARPKAAWKEGRAEILETLTWETEQLRMAAAYPEAFVSSRPGG